MRKQKLNEHRVAPFANRREVANFDFRDSLTFDTNLCRTVGYVATLPK